ncbi:TfpX/TfpZ family type IV pilin accessory protein [Comamonas testosteroni]|uniref:TfpX/TfpZ family type IV pilin accessory protein n=1 Tax=Comamonas testosteroni TaxID=285 RepID=UPI002DB963E5|nr:TfpX/TfpZ family type IV pilin accessory protein [Comamonas testosteroni]MEB5966277.1 hypothetical protein [Comamonas testosteroni]
MSIQDKLKVSAIHFAISVVIAIIIAWLIFKVWFPYPYYKISDGGRIFLLILCVDLICGPVLTFIVFNKNKKNKEIFFDMAVVAIIQLGALSYGCYALKEARPLYTVFEVDRFRVVTASEVQSKKNSMAPKGLENKFWDGPKVIGLREPNDGQEYLKSLEMSLNGIPPSVRPDWWAQYIDSKEKILSVAHEVSFLYKYRPDEKNTIHELLKSNGYSSESVLWLPLTSEKNMGWIVFIDKNSAALIAYAEIDGFISE